MSKLGQNDAHDASSRFIWPPVIYSTAGLVALALYWKVNLALVPEAMRLPSLVLGAVLCAAGGIVAMWAEILFFLTGTATLPIHPTSTIVSRGIYARTRNPMYLGMSLFLAGLAFALNSLWFAVVLPFAVTAVTKLAIVPEERYLECKFGEAYRTYKSNVRRWI